MVVTTILYYYVVIKYYIAISAAMKVPGSFLEKGWKVIILSQ